MSREIIRHQTARDDILSEAYAIGERDLNASDCFLSATEAAIRRLAEMPGLGSVRRFKNPLFGELRMWPIPGFRKHLIFYRASEDTLEVVRVVHGARDLAVLFAEEKKEPDA